MNTSCAVYVVIATVVAASCGGRISALPTGPSLTDNGSASAAVGAVEAASPPNPASHLLTGSVGPAATGTPVCFADRYPCNVYHFSLAREGQIEVTLTWDGTPRALFVQLYWAGEGLAHEDVAPRSGPSQISFVRPRMEAARYEVRVVSREPERAIPFTLTLTY
jgi:hypothetical protein